MLNLHPYCHQNCPGCSHRQLTKDESEIQKQHWIESKMKDIVEVINPIQAVIEEKRWAYRSKVQLTANYSEQGWDFGLIRRDVFEPTPQCPIQAPSVNSSIALLKEILPEYRVFPLHFYIQTGTIATLVLKTLKEPNISVFSEDVKEKFRQNGLSALWIHLNPSAGRRMFEKTSWINLFGERTARDFGKLLYGATSFQQLIPELYVKSLQEAEQFLNASSDSVVADLYCGIGHSMELWARQEAAVIGIETGKEAVECALQNVPSAKILRGTCELRLPQLRVWSDLLENKDKQRLLYVNPPRTGIEPKVLDWIINEYKPIRVAYLSCSMGTLRRDLLVFKETGYKVLSVSPYDFFPQTYHVESLALLEISQ